MPLYFVMDGSNFRSTFTDTMPAKHQRCCKFQVGGKKTGGLPLMTMVFLQPAVDMPTDDTKCSRPYNLPSTCKSNPSLVPFLKSHLQKCIRREEGELALTTAATLIDLDIVELLRRLPIIMIEDAMLMEEMITLVWLMIAYSVPREQLPKFFTDASTMMTAEPVRCWIDALVTKLVRCKWVDCTIDTGKGTCGTADNYPSNAQINALIIADEFKGTKMSDLLYAIKIRKYYGGTTGDMAMLQSAIKIWYDRAKVPELKERYTEVKSLLPRTSDSIIRLQDATFDLDAVDFHWSPIHKMLAAAETDSKLTPMNVTSEDDWRRILWDCSSSLTNKINVGIQSSSSSSSSDVATYNKHKPLIRSIQKQLLLNLLGLPTTK
jgi:hypothetical protein